MSPIQRLAVSIETAVYGWIDVVADRAGSGDPSDDDPLASPLTLVATGEPAPAGAWPQAS